MNKSTYIENNNISDNMTSNSYKQNIKIRADSLDNLSSSSREDDGKFKNGRWLPCEHLRFIKGCLLHGNNWKKVKYTLFILKKSKLLTFRCLISFSISIHFINLY
jgi:hypothetical protein